MRKTTAITKLFSVFTFTPSTFREILGVDHRHGDPYKYDISYVKGFKEQ
jgi:hypothetical protein